MSRTPVLSADDFGRIQRDYATVVDDLRVALATSRNVREAFPIYRALEYMTRELLALTDQAAARCDDLMRED